MIRLADQIVSVCAWLTNSSLTDVDAVTLSIYTLESVQQTSTATKVVKIPVAQRSNNYTV